MDPMIRPHEDIIVILKERHVLPTFSGHSDRNAFFFHSSHFVRKSNNNNNRNKKAKQFHSSLPSISSVYNNGVG